MLFGMCTHSGAICPSFYGSLAVCCVTSHDTSAGLLGIFQALNMASDTPENFSGVALSY